MKNKQITIVEVAKAAGVSIATVSNVLNRRNVPLAEETIRKVEEAAARLGYRRNVVAANLSRKRTFEFGMIIPSFGGYYGDFAQVMQETAHQCGYNLSVFSSSRKPEMEQRHMEMLLQRRVDGLFCHGLAMSPDTTRMIVGDGTPLVLFNAWGWPQDFALGAVNLDIAAGCSDIVRHLYERGCRSLFYMANAVSGPTDGQRKEGFHKGIEKLGYPADCAYGVIETYGRDYGECLREALERSVGKEPIGLLAFDDLAAFAQIARLRDLGYEVPGRFKVAGINNQQVAQWNSPGITSLDISYDAQARTALHLLLQHRGDEKPLAQIPVPNMEGRKDENGFEIHIPMQLIARRSTE